MEDTSDDFQEKLIITDKEIFTKIWTSPRLVFKYINENSYDKFMYVLLMLAGITSAFDRASSKNMGDNMPLVAVLLVCIIAGSIFGWISYYIYAALLSWTGKWLNGEGNTGSLLRILSYAMIPTILSLLLLIPRIAVFGNAFFQNDTDIFGSGITAIIIFVFTLLIEIILGIWSLVLLVIGISEVQKLSIGKSILNLVMPAFIIIVPIAFFAFIIGDLLK